MIWISIDVKIQGCLEIESQMTEQNFKGKSTSFEWGCKGFLKIEILKGISCHLVNTGQKDTKLGFRLQISTARIR